jgi:polar amino acid transport system permease protein
VTGFDLGALDREAYGLIFEGFVLTCKLAAVSLALACLVGLVVGTARWSNLPVLRQVTWLYVETARNTPPLVQILFWYFSASVLLPEWAFMRLRNAGYEFSAAAIALSLYHGAFMAEVFRAGLNAIGAGQFHAARALGMNFGQVLTRIAAPQVARITAPPMINEAVALVKSTSLALAIGLAELTYQYKHIDNFMFRGVEALVVVTALYLALCLALSQLGRHLADRLSRPRVAAGASRA